jgi:hypothetical protein
MINPKMVNYGVPQLFPLTILLNKQFIPVARLPAEPSFRREVIPLSH